MKLVELLIRVGVDVIAPSNGGNAHSQRITPIGQQDVRKGYQTQMAAQLKKLYNGKVLVAPVGKIADGTEANRIIEQNEGDFVHVG